MDDGEIEDIIYRDEMKDFDSDPDDSEEYASPGHKSSNVGEESKIATVKERDYSDDGRESHQGYTSQDRKKEERKEIKGGFIKGLVNKYLLGKRVD
jgi:hypothetical protein